MGFAKLAFGCKSLALGKKRMSMSMSMAFVMSGVDDAAVDESGRSRGKNRLWRREGQRLWLMLMRKFRRLDGLADGGRRRLARHKTDLAETRAQHGRLGCLLVGRRGARQWRPRHARRCWRLGANW